MLLELLYDSYRTEARWQKAVQHLRDEGKLLGEPKDIGPLMAEIWRDLVEEEKAELHGRIVQALQEALG